MYIHRIVQPYHLDLEHFYCPQTLLLILSDSAPSPPPPPAASSP